MKNQRCGILLSILLVLTTGCMVVPGKSSPRMPRPRSVPEIEGAPAIRAYVRSTGVSGKGAARSMKRASRFLDRACRRLDFLTPDCREVEAPDYEIALHVSSKTNEDGLALSYVTMMVFPGWMTDEVNVSATVKDAQQNQVGIYQARSSMLIVVQMHLLYLAPISGPLIPLVEKKTWNRAFVNALTQAGQAIEERQRTAALQGEEESGRPGCSRRPLLARNGS